MKINENWILNNLNKAVIINPLQYKVKFAKKEERI